MVNLFSKTRAADPTESGSSAWPPAGGLGLTVRTNEHLQLLLVSGRTVRTADLKTRFTVREVKLLLSISVRSASHEKGLQVSFSAGPQRVWGNPESSCTLYMQWKMAHRLACLVTTQVRYHHALKGYFGIGHMKPWALLPHPAAGKIFHWAACSLHPGTEMPKPEHWRNTHSERQARKTTKITQHKPEALQ